MKKVVKQCSDEITIGALKNAISKRPGYPSNNQYIPNTNEYAEFWQHAYSFLKKHECIQCPTKKEEIIINELFGYFGKQLHPITKQEDYFHIGLDISAPRKTPIYPILPGILEYSGFTLTNGWYVMLSHPHITSEDGFTLYTLYMHCRQVSVKFNTYQKMLREVSMHTHPKIIIDKETQIAEVGWSGNVENTHSHVHIQCEFRNKEGDIVAINPSELLDIPHQQNLSQGYTKDQWEELQTVFSKQITQYGIKGYWEQ